MVVVVVGEDEAPNRRRVDPERLHVREQDVAAFPGVEEQARLVEQAGEPPVRCEPLPAGDVVVDFGDGEHENRLLSSGLSLAVIMLPDGADWVGRGRARGSECPGPADEKEGAVTR